MPRANRDRCHLEILREHLTHERVFPPYSKIGQLLGLRGKAGAYKVVRRLIGAGYLRHTPDRRIAPTDRFFEIPLADEKLPAGLAESTSWSPGVDPQGLDRLLIKKPASTTLIRIRGDSMIEAGIRDGDIAIVDHSENAVAGDFVVALVDGQCTVKELRFDRREAILVPHNKNYETIRPGHDLHILGIVCGIARQYPHGRRMPGKTGAHL